MRSMHLWPLALLFLFAGCPDTGDDDSGSPGDDDTTVGDDDAGDDDTADDDSSEADDDTANPCDDHCSSGVQDCGESGVDCGGDCDACGVDVLWTEYDGTFPTIAATADKVVVAWCHEGVKFICNDGQGWGGVHELDVGTTYTKATRMAADSQGRIHLVVTHGGGVDIEYAVLSAEPGCAQSTWSVPEGLAEPALGGRYPNIAVDVDDDPHVIWHDEAYTNVYYRKGSGGGWPDPVQQVTTTEWDSRFADVSVSGTTPHVIYEQDDSSHSNCHPSYTTSDGSGWTDPLDLVDSYHSWPQIAAEADGDLHVLYTKRHGDCEVKYRHLDGGVWGGEHTISTAPTEWSWSSLTLDGVGGMHAVWHQVVGDFAQVFYAVGDTDAGTWDAPRQVSVDTEMHNWQAAIALDPEGIAHIAWMHVQPATEEGQIRYRAVQFSDL